MFFLSTDFHEFVKTIQENTGINKKWATSFHILPNSSFVNIVPFLNLTKATYEVDENTLHIVRINKLLKVNNLYHHKSSLYSLVTDSVFK
jgi:hypothetical protein